MTIRVGLAGNQIVPVLIKCYSFITSVVAVASIFH